MLGDSRFLGGRARPALFPFPSLMPAMPHVAQNTGVICGAEGFVAFADSTATPGGRNR